MRNHTVTHYASPFSYTFCGGCFPRSRRSHAPRRTRSPAPRQPSRRPHCPGLSCFTSRRLQASASVAACPPRRRKPPRPQPRLPAQSRTTSRRGYLAGSLPLFLAIAPQQSEVPCRGRIRQRAFRPATAKEREKEDLSGGILMATSKASPDRDAIVAEIRIAAPPERVFRRLSTPGKFCNGGASKASIGPPSFKQTCAPAENGALQESTRKAATSRLRESTWKSTRLVCWFTRGSPVGPGKRKLPSAGSCIRTRKVRS